MDPFWLIRISRWARRPPSARTVVVALSIVAVCLALVAVEAIWGWPEALTPERFGRFGAGARP